MARSIRLLGLLSLLLFSGAPALGQEMQGAQPIGNWPAPLLWSVSDSVAPALFEKQSGSVRLESSTTLQTPPLPLIGVTPCRIADTRGNGFTGPYGPPSLAGSVSRDIPLTGQCGIAGTAQAVSLNITVTNTQGPGFISIYPQGGVAPLVSTLNYVAGQTVANAAVVPLGTAGGITVVAGVSGTDLIIDTNGYYDNSGLITEVTPGTGMMGGGTSGTVSLGIAPGGVTSTELASNAVTSSKIAANAVTAGAIAAGEVGTTQLANAAVTKGKLAAAGGTNGQVLATDGSGLVWQWQGLALPYSGVASQTGIAFQINPGSGASWITALKGRAATSSDVWYLFPVGVSGVVDDGYGVAGSAGSGQGVYGSSYGSYGVEGASNTSDGVHGISGAVGKSGVYGNNVADGGYGVTGRSGSSAGVYGVSTSGDGVRGESTSGYGVYGVRGTYQGYLAYSDGGVLGMETGSGHYGYLGMSSYAGLFSGPVQINGTLTATGNKNFRIDHPLDPENRELWHAAVESSEVLNVYSGNVVTDAEGRAVMELPAWFEALNTDFRYQLTVIGQFARVIVEKEIEQNRFAIRTDIAGVKVSWQITARRNDAWMHAHPFAAERDKPADERGTYLAPLEYGQPEEKGVEWVHHPDLMKRPKENAEKAIVKSR